MTDSPVQIRPDELSAEALHNIVEEFVTRDGTEFTESTKKVEQVIYALERGHAELWYDGKSKTCNIVAVH